MNINTAELRTALTVGIATITKNGPYENGYLGYASNLMSLLEPVKEQNEVTSKLYELACTLDVQLMVVTMLVLQYDEYKCPVFERDELQVTDACARAAQAEAAALPTMFALLRALA